MNTVTKINLNVTSETARLTTVVLGIATDIGDDYRRNNPKIKQHIAQGTAPTEAALVGEVESFAAALRSQGVEVFRPESLPATLQIFTRDIAFTVGDRLVKANMRRQNRQREIGAIAAIIEQIEPGKLLVPPAEATVEGGDVLLHRNHIFVGQSARTNRAGYEFLADTFPQQEVIPLEVVVSDDPRRNILHLDCAFQPVGPEFAILYEDGFRQRPDAIFDLFGERNLIRVTGDEMYQMFPNIFSVSPEVVISEQGFTRLNTELRRRGLTVIEIPYAEVSKLGGLLRCSTLPLNRDGEQQFD